MASNPTSQEVYTYLRKKGLNNNQAQGILANIIGESGLNMAAEGDRRSGGSIGLFQYNYNAGRAQPFVAAVPDWKTNWRGQVDYVIDKDPQTKAYLSKTFNSRCETSSRSTRLSGSTRGGRNDATSSFSAPAPLALILLEKILH